MKIFLRPAFLIPFALLLLHQVGQYFFGWRLPFIDSYFDPFAAMLVLLTFLLFERRLLYRAGDDYVLSIFEIVVATVVVFCIGEFVFPYLKSDFIYDPLDGIAYLCGSVYFYLFLNRSNSAV